MIWKKWSVEQTFSKWPSLLFATTAHSLLLSITVLVWVSCFCFGVPSIYRRSLESQSVLSVKPSKLSQPVKTDLNLKGVFSICIFYSVGIAETQHLKYCW